LTQVLDLAGGFDTVWSTRYRKQVRNIVRKAERSSLDIRREHGGRAIEAFAELYRQSVDRWARLRGQPLPIARLLARRRDRAGQLAAAAAALGERCVIWSAYRAGEPVAVEVTLELGQHSIVWLSASNRDLAGPTGASYLLHSLAIQDACRTGTRYFYMGESNPGSGVEHFKAKFGATPLEYAALRFERLPITGAERRLRAAVEQLSTWRTRRSRRDANPAPV
jgi:hypothetical protein